MKPLKVVALALLAALLGLAAGIFIAGPGVAVVAFCGLERSA